MNTRPIALQLADVHEDGSDFGDSTAAELRRLHFENLEQARLLGMSAEREVALIAKIEEHAEKLKIASGIEAMVCLDITVRQEQGIKKYGTTVAENPLSLKQWLQHAYEECLDQAIYLKRAIQENDKVIKETAKKCAEIADIAEPYKADDLIRKHFGVEE